VQVKIKVRVKGRCEMGLWSLFCCGCSALFLLFIVVVIALLWLL